MLEFYSHYLNMTQEAIFKMQRMTFMSSNILKKICLFFITSAIICFLTANMAVALVEKEITTYPGETVTGWKIRFDNVGDETAHNVWTTPKGDASSWVSPGLMTFGNVGAGQVSEAKGITINVPEYAQINRQYDLWYEFYADEGETGGKIHLIITITAQPETNDESDDGNSLRSPLEEY